MSDLYLEISKYVINMNKTNKLFSDYDATQKRLTILTVMQLKIFNPFDTLRFGNIRLFERPNRGMLIRATRCHEFTSQEQVLKCGSAGATFGFQWH